MIVFTEDQINTPKFEKALEKSIYENLYVLDRRSNLTGKKYIAFFDVDARTWANAAYHRNNGKPIQSSHYFLNSDERKFVLTGVPPGE